MAKKKVQVVDAASAPRALVTLAEALDDIETDVEKAELKLKELKKKAYFAEKKLVDQMVTEGVPSFRTLTRGGFRAEPVVYPGVKAENKEKFEKWVKKKKYTFLFTRSIHGGKFKSFAKEVLSEGKTLPPFIDVFNTTEIRRFK